MLDISIARYSEPGEFDHAPKGSLCKRIKSLSADFELWTQVSENNEKPNWVLVGSYTKDSEESSILKDISLVIR